MRLHKLVGTVDNSSSDTNHDQKVKQSHCTGALSIYIAGPLRNSFDAQKMRKLGMILMKEGYDVYMACDLDEKNPKARFETDISEIDRRDILVASFDKMTFGTIFECGYAFAKGKKVLILSKMSELKDHPFVMNGCKLLGSSVEELMTMLRNEKDSV